MATELTADQIRELVRRQKDGAVYKELTSEFRIPAGLITQILRGRRYSEITGIEPVHSEHCTDCKGRDIREDNIDAARDVLVTVQCHICHAKTERAAGHVLSMRGGVRCLRCDGRRK